MNQWWCAPIDLYEKGGISHWPLSLTLPGRHVTTHIDQGIGLHQNIDNRITVCNTVYLVCSLMQMEHNFIINSNLFMMELCLCNIFFVLQWTKYLGLKLKGSERFYYWFFVVVTLYIALIFCYHSSKHNRHNEILLNISLWCQCSFQL